jgi:glycosyltransferase involved in cell wall biosynthesis
LFLLPTFTENFGIVVAEALACGLPVLTTVGTPRKDLGSRNCGCFIETGTAPLLAALKGIFELDSSVLRQMGVRGRQWVLQEYQWPGIAERCIALYAGIVGDAARLGLVHIG